MPVVTVDYDQVVSEEISSQDAAGQQVAGEGWRQWFAHVDQDITSRELFGVMFTNESNLETVWQLNSEPSASQRVKAKLEQSQTIESL